MQGPISFVYIYKTYQHLHYFALVSFAKKKKKKNHLPVQNSASANKFCIVCTVYADKFCVYIYIKLINAYTAYTSKFLDKKN